MKRVTQKPSGHGGTLRYYEEVPDKIAIDKVKQGLRHQVEILPFHNKKGMPDTTASPKTWIKQDEKPQQSQCPSITGRAYGRNSISMDTSKQERQLSDHVTLSQTEGEKCDSLPLFSTDNAAPFRPDFRVLAEMMGPPTMVGTGSPTTTNNRTSLSQGGRAEYLTQGPSVIDHGYHHGVPENTLLLHPNGLQQLAPSLSTMIPAATTTTIPTLFLRRSTSRLPTQHPLFQLLPLLRGDLGTRRPALEQDHSVLDLLTLWLGQPHSGMLWQHNLSQSVNTREDGQQLTALAAALATIVSFLPETSETRVANSRNQDSTS